MSRNTLTKPIDLELLEIEAETAVENLLNEARAVKNLVFRSSASARAKWLATSALDEKLNAFDNYGVLSNTHKLMFESADDKLLAMMLYQNSLMGHIKYALSVANHAIKFAAAQTAKGLHYAASQTLKGVCALVNAIGNALKKVATSIHKFGKEIVVPTFGLLGRTSNGAVGHVKAKVQTNWDKLVKQVDKMEKSLNKITNKIVATVNTLPTDLRDGFKITSGEIFGALSKALIEKLQGVKSASEQAHREGVESQNRLHPEKTNARAARLLLTQFSAASTLTVPSSPTSPTSPSTPSSPASVSESVGPTDGIVHATDAEIDPLASIFSPRI